jgi:hypothetical protein
VERQLVAKWQTSGARYAIELYRLEGSFEYRFLTHGKGDGFAWRPGATKAQVLDEVDGRIRDALAIDGIRYALAYMEE